MRGGVIPDEWWVSKIDDSGEIGGGGQGSAHMEVMSVPWIQAKIQEREKVRAAPPPSCAPPFNPPFAPPTCSHPPRSSAPCR